ncbi:hypothetical protein JKF63_04691 [Porcisia hertigi]|uniref:Histone RNA hairpin-binding protein RNA-binding domain-containing protein n=1 Tax=Porcisia hertigi TaxID=2761500 RepID=A0A836ITQ1_9TRYP|nr:hypothetical protein JKF63_04691 [Porcisia hertigi]
MLANRSHAPVGDAARHIYCAAGIDRADVAQLGGAAMPPFSWTPKSYAANHTSHFDSAERGTNATVSTETIMPQSIVDLGTTPDTHRRSRDMTFPSQHLPDSSLVFAMSEDSELKVLASGASPQVALHATTCGSSSNVTQSPLERRTHNSANHSRITRSHVPVVGDTGNVDGCVYARNRRSGRHDQDEGTSTTFGEYNAAAEMGHLMPHTSCMRRDHDASVVLPGGLHGEATWKPSVQHVSNQQPGGNPGREAAAMASAPSSTGVVAAPAYRTSPHDLRTPPALQVFAGAVPRYHKVRESTAAATAAPAPAAAAAAAAPTASSHTGANARWPQRRMPSVSGYAGSGGVVAGATASAHSTNQCAASTGALLAAPSNMSLAQRQQLTQAQPSQPPPSGGASNAADARSQQSGTPPPPPTSQPLDKNFTEAQRLAVLEEVQQELYLNYTAVPVPENMMNSGDTEERRRRLDQRRKQIIYGKETEGYLKYTTLIPQPCDREYHNPLHAITPRPEHDCSKRQFDRVLNAWRRQLHQWDECDLDNIDERFLPLGKASLLDLGLCHPPSNSTPTTATETADTSAAKRRKPPQAPTAGVMHSIANVAALANSSRGDDGAMQSHSRSPVFTENSPTSGLYSTTSLSMHISSGRAASMAAACTPSRPQLSEGPEGPKVDESFFHPMSSGNSRIASPFHLTYSGTGQVGHGGMNGRGSANPYYQQLMIRNSAAYAHNNTSGGTPGGTYANYTGLTPAHRPVSRGGMPPHFSALFANDYELMAPSIPASPAGVPHNPRNGCSPYPLSESWMPHRRSPTYGLGTAYGVGHHPSTVTLSGVAGANGSRTVMVGRVRGESPTQRAELELIPSTSQSNGSGFAQSPYGYRVHSPIQPQGASPQTTTAYVTPITRQQSRLSPSGYANVTPVSTGLPPHQQHQSHTPSGTRVEPPQPQQQRAAVTTGTAASRSARGE